MYCNRAIRRLPYRLVNTHLPKFSVRIPPPSTLQFLSKDVTELYLVYDADCNGESVPTFVEPLWMLTDVKPNNSAVVDVDGDGGGE